MRKIDNLSAEKGTDTKQEINTLAQKETKRSKIKISSLPLRSVTNNGLSVPDPQNHRDRRFVPGVRSMAHPHS
jgi:hypothetical protein